MLRHISLAAAVLLGSCGIRSEVSRPKYLGPITKPIWKADDIQVDFVFIEDSIVYCRARTYASPVRHLYAFDPATGKRLWVSDFEVERAVPHFFAGGAMVTRSGLVFIGGGDGYLYAFDKKNGTELWRGKLPYDTAAVPMTYRTRSGRQFLVVATGSGANNALVAFTLEP